MISGMTYKDAQKHARAEYEKLIDNDIKLKESQHPIAGYFWWSEKKIKS